MIKKSRFPIQEFYNTVKMNPRWSTLTCFYETVWKRDNLNKSTIETYLKELVEKDDYPRSLKDALVSYACELSAGRIP